MELKASFEMQGFFSFNLFSGHHSRTNATQSGVLEGILEGHFTLI